MVKNRLFGYCYLLKDGAEFAMLGTVVTPFNQPASIQIDFMTSNLPKGLYSILVDRNEDSLTKGSASISASQMIWRFNPFQNDMLQIGGDGIAAKFNNNIFHLSENGLVIRGYADIPRPASSLLFSSGSISAGGVLFFNKGDKSVQVTHPEVGEYRIIHTLATPEYTIILTARGEGAKQIL